MIVSVITLLAAEDVGRSLRSMFPASEATDCPLARVYPGMIRLPNVFEDVAEKDSS